MPGALRHSGGPRCPLRPPGTPSARVRRLLAAGRVLRVHPAFSLVHNGINTEIIRGGGPDVDRSLPHRRRARARAALPRPRARAARARLLLRRQAQPDGRLRGRGLDPARAVLVRLESRLAAAGGSPTGRRFRSPSCATTSSPRITDGCARSCPGSARSPRRSWRTATSGRSCARCATSRDAARRARGAHGRGGGAALPVARAGGPIESEVSELEQDHEAPERPRACASCRRLRHEARAATPTRRCSTDCTGWSSTCTHVHEENNVLFPRARAAA